MVAGAALHALLWSRQWVYGDQYELLAPAIELLETHRLPPYAKTMSAGGRIPGALLPLVIGLPLSSWPDYRAPTLLIGLLQIVAVAALAACIGRALGTRFVAAYLSVYCLSPWRLYHAGFLWEPAYLFLPAALHLASAYQLRDRRHLGWSALLAATLVLTLQLHASFAVLAIATGVLAARRLIRIDWTGAILGGLVGSLTLVPTAMALRAGTLPRIVPGDTEAWSPLLGGALNVLKSVVYWLRLGSSDIGRRLRQTVYVDSSVADPTGWTPLASGLTALLIIASTASVLVALLASWHYFRRHPSLDVSIETGREPATRWFRSYAWCCLVAMCAAAAMSPVPLQGWHVVIAFHAACLPVAAWLRAAFWGESSPRRAAAASFVILEVAVVLVLAFGHPMYRPLAGDELARQDLPEVIRPLMPDER